MDQATEKQSPAVTSMPAPQLQPLVPPATQVKLNESQFFSKNYFPLLFSGRLNRRNYIVGSLVFFLSTIVLVLLASLFLVIPMTHVIPNAESPIGITIFSVLTIVALCYLIFFIINTFALTMRRLHDLNHTGWLWLLSCIPVVNLLFTCYLVFSPGTNSENKYGNIPFPRIDLKRDIFRL